MRISDPAKCEEIITGMAIKYPGWVFKVWLIWFMQREDFTIGPTEIGNRLKKRKSAVSNALKILRENDDLTVTNLLNKGHEAMTLGSRGHDPKVTRACTKGHEAVNLTSKPLKPVIPVEKKSESFEEKTENTSQTLVQRMDEIGTLDYVKKLQLILELGPKGSLEISQSYLTQLAERGSLSPKQTKVISDVWGKMRTMALAQNVKIAKRKIKKEEDPDAPPEPYVSPPNVIKKSNFEGFGDADVQYVDKTTDPFFQAIERLIAEGPLMPIGEEND